MTLDAQVELTRRRITEIGRLLFDRFLTDAAGGNISSRAGDCICITPRYSGGRHQWHLRPEQVLVCDLDGKQIAGEGELSREAEVHLRLYRDFADCGAVIHAHPRHVLVFCAAARPIVPVLEGTLKFGEVKVVEFAPAHSPDLAEHVARGIQGQEERIRRHAAAVIAPWHGLFVAGRDLNLAFDAVERIDENAQCLLQGQALVDGADALRRERQALADAMARHK